MTKPKKTPKPEWELEFEAWWKPDGEATRRDMAKNAWQTAWLRAYELSVNRVIDAARVLAEGASTE